MRACTCLDGFLLLSRVGLKWLRQVQLKKYLRFPCTEPQHGNLQFILELVFGDLHEMIVPARLVKEITSLVSLPRQHQLIV